jgi:hypothetical protein
VCSALRSVFDALDSIDTLSDDIGELMPQMDKLDAIMPEMLKLLTPMVAMMKSMHTMMLSMHSTMAGMQDQGAAMQSKGNAMGQAFDTSKNDDSFYLPPEVFDNPDFKRGMNMFISPDGKSVRFIISHLGDPATPEGIARVDAIRNAAFEAIKGTSLENARIYIAGTAATAKDMKEGSTYDLLIVGVGALILIFIVMLAFDPRRHRRSGHRRDRAALPGCLLRYVGVDVAVHPGHRSALDDPGDVGDHPARGRIGRQLAAGIAIQRGDPRRHHQIHGRHRRRRHVRRPGIHHDHHGSERPAHPRPVRHHHRIGPAVRHTGGALIDDTIDRRAAGTLVLVAPTHTHEALATTAIRLAVHHSAYSRTLRNARDRARAF